MNCARYAVEHDTDDVFPFLTMTAIALNNYLAILHRCTCIYQMAQSHTLQQYAFHTQIRPSTPHTGFHSLPNARPHRDRARRRAGD